MRDLKPIIEGVLSKTNPGEVTPRQQQEFKVQYWESVIKTYKFKEEVFQTMRNYMEDFSIQGC